MESKMPIRRCRSIVTFNAYSIFTQRIYRAATFIYPPRSTPLWIYGTPSPFPMQSFISAMVFPNVGQPGSVSRINIILVEYSIRRTRRIFPGKRGIRARIFISSRDAVVMAFRETSLPEVPWDRRWTLAVSLRRCTLTTDATISFIPSGQIEASFRLIERLEFSHLPKPIHRCHPVVYLKYPFEFLFFFLFTILAYDRRI